MLLGGIQLFRPSVCNGMARHMGDRSMGKPSRGQSVGVGFDCGGLLEARRRLGLALWHAAAVAKATHGRSCPTDPRYPVLVDRVGAALTRDRRVVGSQWRARVASPLLLSLRE